VAMFVPTHELLLYPESRVLGAYDGPIGVLCILLLLIHIKIYLYKLI